MQAVEKRVMACAAVFLFLLFPRCVLAQNINEIIQNTGAVFTYILDTGTTSDSPLTPTAIEEKSGWTLVSEDDVTHEFLGDAVLLNDRIVVVFRRKAAGVDVYASGEGGPIHRVTLVPAAPERDALESVQQLDIAMNTTGAVEMTAVCGTKQGKPVSLAYRLATGQVYVEMTPQSGVDAILVEGHAQYLVVPDFFADDIVYDPRRYTASSAPLPAENFFFQLSGDGASMVTCVWQSTGRSARVLFDGNGNERTIARSEIECAPGKSVWVAVAERDGLWHARSIEKGEYGGDVALDWRPPFDAKWRGSFVSDSEVAQSWNFAPAREPDYKSPGLGEMVYPCWFTDSHAFLRAPAGTTASSLLGIVYPIDRSQDTPLNEFLLVDVMRGTLGVGPCQYILDMEGLDALSSPTPALVCEYVASQLKKKKSRQDPAAIRERMDAMVEHVAHAEDRIAEYAALSGTIRSIGSTALKSDRPEMNEIVKILEQFDATIAQLAPARRSPADARALADKIIALMGTEDWEETFEKLDAELRAIGSAQDRTLAKCRMDLRRLKQHCVDLEAKHSELASIAKEIIGAIDQTLQAKD